MLQQDVVPHLKDKLEKLSCEEVQQEVQQEGVYLLSDIFTENDDDFIEVDNS